MSNPRPLAMVTGASSGIGAVFARRLSRDGYRLLLVARRANLLEELARELGGAETLAADLTVEEDLRRVEARMGAAGDLELLVNNAGFGLAGRFFETPVEGHTRMHQLHVMATMRLSHAALAGMAARGKGAVINVSSVASFAQSPGSVSYCATKAWITSFTEGLHLDLLSAGSPVRVQALCPGFTYSEFHDVMGMDRNRIPKWMWCTAEDVVEASLRGLAKGRVVVVPGLFYAVLVRVMGWMPRFVFRRLAVVYGRRMRRIARPSGNGSG